MEPNERINSITKFVPAGDVVLKEDGDASGEVRAVFSVFNVKDRHGDIVRKEAFRDGEEIPLVWSHDWSEIIGKGVIRVTDNEAIFEGEFFLDEEDGAKRHKTVKRMGSLMQWSWGFSIKKDGYKILYDEDGMFDGFDIFKTERFEVSPVLVGANQYTRTLDVKSVDGSARRLHDNASIGMWMKSLKGGEVAINTHLSGGSAAALAALAGRDDEQSAFDPDRFYPHDDAHGQPDTAKCLAVIAQLNGGISPEHEAVPPCADSERKALYDHVADHLHSAGIAPPALRSAAEVVAEKNYQLSYLAQLADKADAGVNFAYTDSVSYSDDDVHKVKDSLSHVGVTFTVPHGGKQFKVEADALLASVKSFTARATELVQLRAKQGRRFKWVDEESDELREAVEALLALMNRDSDEPEETTEAETEAAVDAEAETNVEAEAETDVAAEAGTEAEVDSKADDVEHAEAEPAKSMDAERATREIQLREMKLALLMMELDDTTNE